MYVYASYIYMYPPHTYIVMLIYLLFALFMITYIVLAVKKHLSYVQPQILPQQGNRTWHLTYRKKPFFKLIYTSHYIILSITKKFLPTILLFAYLLSISFPHAPSQSCQPPWINQTDGR